MPLTFSQQERLILVTVEHLFNASAMCSAPLSPILFSEGEEEEKTGRKVGTSCCGRASVDVQSNARPISNTDVMEELFLSASPRRIAPASPMQQPYGRTQRQMPLPAKGADRKEAPPLRHSAVIAEFFSSVSAMLAAPASPMLFPGCTSDHVPTHTHKAICHPPSHNSLSDR